MTSVVRVRRVHDVSRRLVLELAVIAVVLLVGRTLPSDDVPGAHWSVLAPYVLFTAHMLVGLLVLVDAARVARAGRGMSPDARVLALAGLAASITAVVTGAVSVLGLTGNSPAVLMAFGWLLAVAVYARLWLATRALLRALRLPVRSTPARS